MTYAPTWNDRRVEGQQRLSDSDRAAAVARLRRHESAGRLTAAEVATRSDAVRSALTRADLGRVFADLPDDHPVRRALRDRRWQTHAVVFALVTTATIVLWLGLRDPDPLPRDYGSDYWWPLWFALLWATVVLLHLLRVAGLLRRSSSAGGPVPVTASVPSSSPVPESPVSPAPPDPDAAAALDRLTAREREVLALVGQGRANKDIAQTLYISERTARTHVSNILRKLDLSSRTQAAILATQAGLTPGADA